MSADPARRAPEFISLPLFLQQLRRIRAAGNESRETLLPLVSMGSSVDEFYEAVEKETHEGKKLPNWCVISGLVPTSKSNISLGTANSILRYPHLSLLWLLAN